MKQMQGLTPVRKTTIIGSVILLVALVAAWMFVLSPRSDAIAAANAEVDQAEQSNQALRAQIVSLHQREAELPELQKVSTALDRRFPPSAEQAKLFKMITAAGAAAGIAPQFITGVLVEAPTGVASAGSAQLPGVAAPISQIAQQKITINVTATESQIRQLMANLEKLPRAFAVDTLSLSKSGGGGATAGTGTAGSPTTPNVDPDAQTATITGNMFVMPKVDYPSKDAKVGAGSAAGSAATSS